MARYLQVFITLATLSVYLEATTNIPATTEAPIRELTYVCETDGRMIITIPAEYSLQNIDSSPCTNSTGQNGKFVLNDCKNKNQTIALKHNSLLGGKMPIFSLKCVDSKYTIQLNATALHIDTNTTLTTMPPHTISHNSKIQMMIKDKEGQQANSAVIGETLSLVISAPENFQVDPLNCNAVSGYITYPIWNASSSPCSVEDSVIASNWKTKKENTQIEYSIEMYAFRLVGYDSVTISCTVDVCPNDVGGCTQTCVTVSDDTKKRKRRNAAIGNSEKVNRHLETNLRVYDSVEDKIQASGASVLTTSYVAGFCALVSALYHRQL